ncbi:MAG: gamma-glutamyltransferase [Sedimenticola sp.]
MSDWANRENQRQQPESWTSRSVKGVVATAHWLASHAGAEILDQGGNAVDAAIASSLALGVCEPAGSGLGGMATMLVFHAGSGRTFTIENPCRAPLLATPERVAQAGRYRGYPAVAVMTYVSVMAHTLSHYGTMAPSQVLAPAIRLAEEGYPVSPFQHKLLQRYKNVLKAGSVYKQYFDAHDEVMPAGTIYRQPDLARTLKRLATAGFNDFYQGEIASVIAKDMASSGGFITADDLISLPRPVERKPLSTLFRDSIVYTVGPPGGGVALLEMLNLFDVLVDRKFDPDRPEGCILLAEIIRRARSDRRHFRLRTGADKLANASELLTKEYANRTAQEIRESLSESGETSHLSVIDSFGNAVAITQSIERSFGAAEMSHDLGFLYNGFMRAFKVENRRHPHYLRPGAVVRSNAVPSLICKGDNPTAALGSTGSERAPSGVFQVLVRLAMGQTPFEAVQAPRLHCTPEREVLLEAERFPDAVTKQLSSQGFNVHVLEPYAFKMGAIQLVVRNDEGIVGVADPRRDGAAIGAAAEG